MKNAQIRLGLAALAAAVVLATGAGAARLKAGRPAPDFRGVTVAGKNLSLAQFRGKTAVLLNFYSNSCPACDEEFPQLKELDEKYRDQGVQIIAVNLERSRRDAMVFALNYKPDFPIVVDGTPIADRYGVHPIPTNVLIDRDGKIVRVIEGYNEKELGEAVRALAGKGGAPAERKIL